MNDLQKEWLAVANEFLDKIKGCVKDNKTLSFGDALQLSKQINSSLNDESLSSAWTNESQEKWKEIKNLFAMLVEPAYFVSARSSSAVN